MAFISKADWQERQNQEMADRRQRAHERFLQGRENFISSSRNSVSHFERNDVLGRKKQLEDEDRLRKHELEMLEKKGASDLAVAEQNKLGMIGQGSEAAKARAEADKEIALRNAETAMATNKAKYGYFDDEGVFHGGSDVAAASAAGAYKWQVAQSDNDAKVKAAEVAASARRDVATTQAGSKEKVAQTNADATVAAAGGRSDEALQRQFQAWQQSLNDLNKTAGMDGKELQKIKAMTPEEQKQYWLKLTGRVK